MKLLRPRQENQKLLNNYEQFSFTQNFDPKLWI